MPRFGEDVDSTPEITKPGLYIIWDDSGYEDERIDTFKFGRYEEDRQWKSYSMSAEDLYLEHNSSYTIWRFDTTGWEKDSWWRVKLPYLGHYTSEMIFCDEDTLLIKCRIILDNVADVKVNVRWDESFPVDKRPMWIDIILLKDEEVYDTVTLQEENNWKYSWYELDDGFNWKIITSNVPSNLNETILIEGNTTIITYSYKDGTTSNGGSPEAPPET